MLKTPTGLWGGTRRLGPRHRCLWRETDVNETPVRAFRSRSRRRTSGGARDRSVDRCRVGQRESGSAARAARPPPSDRSAPSCRHRCPRRDAPHDLRRHRVRAVLAVPAPLRPVGCRGGDGRRGLSPVGCTGRATLARIGRVPHLPLDEATCRSVRRCTQSGRGSGSLPIPDVGATGLLPNAAGATNRADPGACVRSRRCARSLSLQDAVTCAGAHDPKPQCKVVRISGCSGCASGSDTSPADDPIRKHHQDL